MQQCAFCEADVITPMYYTTPEIKELHQPLPVYRGRYIAAQNAVPAALKLYYNKRHPLTPKALQTQANH